MDNSILVAVTCYNCETQVTRVLEQLKTPLAKKWIKQTVVIDNHSLDGTYKAASDWQALNDINLQVVQNERNFGLGGSHKSAFSYAKTKGFSHVVILHGDDQANLEELLLLLEREGLNVDQAYLGARFHPKSTLKGYSTFRKLGNQVFNTLFSIVSCKKILDLGSGLNMYPVETLQGEWYKRFPDDLTFNYVFFLALFQRKVPCQFFPITWVEEDQISNVRMVKQTKTLMTILLTYAFSKKRFFTKEHREEVLKDYNFSKKSTV